MQSKSRIKIKKNMPNIYTHSELTEQDYFEGRVEKRLYISKQFQKKESSFQETRDLQ